MSWFSEIVDWFVGEVKGQQLERKTLLIIPANHIYVTKGAKLVEDATAVETAIIAQRHYLRAWVRDTRLEKDRRWFTTMLPAIHSYMKLNFAQKEQEFAYIAGPAQLKAKLNVANLDKGVALNFPLSPLLPFNGGDVTINAGLVSVPVRNDLKTLLNVVSGFAEALGVTQASKALGVVDSIASGIAQLLGTKEAELKLFFKDTYTATGGGTQLRSCYLLATDQDAGKLKASDVWLIDSELRVGSTLTAAQKQPLGDCDYMVIHLQAVDERDDWDSIEAIATPFAEAVKLLMDGKKEEAQVEVNRAKKGAVMSPDLTNAQRFKIAGVAGEIQQRFDQLAAGTPSVAQLAAASKARISSLEGAAQMEIDAAYDAMPASWRAGLPPALLVSSGFVVEDKSGRKILHKNSGAASLDLGFDE